MQEKNRKRSGRGPWSLWAAAGTVAALSVLAAAVIALEGGRAGVTGATTPSAPQISVAVSTSP